MLRDAHRRAQEESIHNVTFVRASAMEIPLADGCFDAANCSGALHLFPNAGKALREVARVLRKGGSFTAAAFRRPGRSDRAKRWKAVGLTAFADNEMERLLFEAGFEQMRILHRSFRWLVVAARRAA
jgi:ubiquinone/menaquinone biosynthesis C-methylase UbiE